MDLDDTIKGVAEMTEKEPENALWNYSLKWLLELKTVRTETDNKMVKAYKLGYTEAMKEYNKTLGSTLKRFEEIFDE